MTLTPLLSDRGPSTYLDTLDASTDHSGAFVAPLRKNRTTLLVGQTLGNPELGATFAGSLVLTAAEAFDGTVTLTATPIADPWSPSLLLADLPDTDGPTATFTGTIAAGQTISFDIGPAGTAFGAASITCEGWLVVRTDSGTQGSVFTARINDDRAPVVLGGFLSDPDAPTGVVPNSDLIVGVPKPVVKADQPASAMDKQQWQVGNSAVGFDPGTGLSSPSFDSGQLDSTALQLDLSTTAFGGFPAAGTTRYLTCRYRSADGTWSDWAPPEQVGGWLARPVPTITSQSAGIADEPTPPISWTPSGTQTQFQVLCYPFGSTTALTDSERTPSTATTYQPFPAPQLGTTDGTEPGILCKGSEPIVSVVRQWDDQARIATPGCPVYGEASNTFQFFGNAAVNGPDDVSVQQILSSPWFTYQITLSPAVAANTQYVIFSLGPTPATAVHIARKKLSALPAPVESEGSLIYTWICWTAQPWQPSYAAGVKLVDNSGQTSDAVYDSLTSLDPVGEWVGDADPQSLTYGVMAFGTGASTTTDRDGIQIDFINGLGQRFPVPQTNGEGYMVLSLGGIIFDSDGVSSSENQRAWRRLNDNMRVVQYAKGDMSFPALLTGYAVDEVLEAGNTFVKKYTATITQLDTASYADEPIGFGAPVEHSYDFESLVDGDAPTDGLPILRDDTDGGTGSPGVIDKDGQPVHSTAAALHNEFGAFLGPHG